MSLPATVPFTILAASAVIRNGAPLCTFAPHSDNPAQKAVASVTKEGALKEAWTLPSQLADYEITGTVLDDGTTPCLSARRPARLGGDGAPVTIWVLGPLARTSWTVARARLEPIAGVRGDNLPAWLEAGVAEWSQRPVIWVSASNIVTGTLASPPPAMEMPTRLKALAAAARAAHSLHEQGQLHGAICPQAVALVAANGARPRAARALSAVSRGRRGPPSSPLPRWRTASDRQHRWVTPRWRTSTLSC